MKSSILSFFVFTGLLLFSFCAKDGSSNNSEKVVVNETEMSENKDTEPEKNADVSRISDEERLIEKMKSYFLSNGIQETKVDDVLETVLSLSQKIPTDEKNFEIPSVTKNQLMNEVGLTVEQVELVKMAAMRVANKKVQMGNVRGYDREKKLADIFKEYGFTDMKGLKSSLKENGISDEQMESALSGMVRVLNEVKAEGENFELDQSIRNFMEKRAKLSEAQIQFIQTTAVIIVDESKK